MQIKDKQAIIVGTVSQLGIAFCRELLRNGAGNIVAIGDLESSDVTAVDELNLEFGQKKISFIPCDISKHNEFDAIFKDAINVLGGLDIVINNANLINESDIMNAIDVNITAVIRSTLLGVQQMGKDFGARGGIVVNVTSVFGLEPLSQLPVYSTAKQAVISFSRSFSQPYHYQRTGVKIVTLCPGLTGSKIDENLTSTETNSLAVETPAVTIHPQKVDSIAHSLVYIIRCAQNGSIWVSENSEPVYEIQPPDVLPQKVKEDDLE